MEKPISSDKRRSLLISKIKEKGFVRIIEAHNGLSALVGQRAQVKQKDVIIEYDDFWFNVRPSNTEPLLRLNLEAKTKDKMIEMRDKVLTIIQEET